MQSVIHVLCTLNKYSCGRHVANGVYLVNDLYKCLNHYLIMPIDKIIFYLVAFID